MGYFISKWPLMCLNLELKMAWSSYVDEVSHVFSYLKLNFFLKLISTRHLSVPSSAFHGKENQEQSEPIKLPRGGGGAKNMLPFCSPCFLLQPWSPFFFFFVLSVTKKCTWGHGLPFLLHPFKVSLVYNTQWRDLKIESIFFIILILLSLYMTCVVWVRGR